MATAGMTNKELRAYITKLTKVDQLREIYATLGLAAAGLNGTAEALRAAIYADLVAKNADDKAGWQPKTSKTTPKKSNRVNWKNIKKWLKTH